MINRKLAVFFFLFISIAINAKKFEIKYSQNEKYQLTIKSNFKTYNDNKYIGLQTNELKGILDVRSSTTRGMNIEGTIYHLKKAIRGTQNIGYYLDQYEPVQFTLNKNGLVLKASNPLFPPLNGVPFFPEKELKIDEIYTGYGKASIQLLNSDDIETIEIEITYQYKGKKTFYQNEYDFFLISYNYTKPYQSKNLKLARGRHNLELFFDNTHGKPIFIKDLFVEEIKLKNNNKTIKRDGFIFYFYKMIKPMDTNRVMQDLTEDIDKNYLKDLKFQNKKEGISVTINNLNFKADSTQLLTTEYSKLENIYKMLSKIKDKSFLIIGHTALAGTEENRMRLSRERAETIANYLIKKGISEDKIIHTGKGAKDPIAPNDSEENRKKNRRVEIIILDD